MKLPLQLQNYLRSHDNVVSKIIPLDPYNDYPKFFHFSAPYQPNVLNETKLKLEPNALSDSHDDAIIRTCMEAIERYGLINILKEDLVKGNYQTLKKKYPIPNPIEFYYDHTDPNLLINKRNLETQSFVWIKSIELLSQKNYYIPAQLIYFLPSAFNEPYIRLPDTTGAASAFTLEQAIIQSICEIIERESFAVFFYTQAHFNRIKISVSEKGQITRLISYLNKYFLSPVIVDITTDTKIPTYCCWLLNSSKLPYPQLVVGISSNPSKKIAIKKAILEAVQSLTNCRNMLTLDLILEKQNSKRPYLNRASVRNMLYWAEKNPAQKDFLKFFTSLKEKTISLKNDERSLTSHVMLKNILQNLQEVGIKNIYSVNISPYLAKYGIYNIRVVIPGLLPLSLHTPYSYSKSARILEISKKLGINSIQNPNFFTNIPHPFP